MLLQNTWSDVITVQPYGYNHNCQNNVTLTIDPGNYVIVDLVSVLPKRLQVTQKPTVATYDVGFCCYL